MKNKLMNDDSKKIKYQQNTLQYFQLQKKDWKKFPLNCLMNKLRIFYFFYKFHITVYNNLRYLFDLLLKNKIDHKLIFFFIIIKKIFLI